MTCIVQERSSEVGFHGHSRGRSTRALPVAFGFESVGGRSRQIIDELPTIHPGPLAILTLGPTG